MLKLFKKKERTQAKTDCVDAEPLVTVTMSLDKFEIGQSGEITSIGGDGKIRRRLFDMGVTPGAVVYLRKRAPLGDPIEVTIRDYELTLRKTEAAVVMLRTEVRKGSEAGDPLNASEVKND